MLPFQEVQQMVGLLEGVRENFRAIKKNAITVCPSPYCCCMQTAANHNLGSCMDLPNLPVTPSLHNFCFPGLSQAAPVP